MTENTEQKPDEIQPEEKPKKQKKYKFGSSLPPFHFLAIEVFSIVLGVMLALAVNRWNDNRNHRAEAREALNIVAHEIQSNLEMLTFIHENNAGIFNDSLATDNDPESERSFVPGLQLQSSAWETMMTAGVPTYLDYDLLHDISSLYSIQDIYRESGLQLTQAYITAFSLAGALGNEIDGEGISKQLEPTMRLLIMLEEQLLIDYNSLLGSLEKNGIWVVTEEQRNNKEG